MASPARAVATCFGIGYVPYAPGTVASLVSVPVGWWFAFMGSWYTLFVFVITVVLLGIWSSSALELQKGEHDPSECVIDEVAGQWLALMPLAFSGKLLSLLGIVLAFVLFRLFDVIKPYPISRLERLPGGLGVMADDIMAGIFAGILVMLAAQLEWI